MLYVLGAILEPWDTIIVAVLGIIYGTIRSAALFQYFTMMQMAWASDVQSLEQRRRIKEVSASRGKAIAEPVSLLYEKQRVLHRRDLDQLEAEMMAFSREWDRSVDGSPNRLWGQARMMSFAVTPGGCLPSTTARMFFLVRISVCVASTCSNSDVGRYHRRARQRRRGSRCGCRRKRAWVPGNVNPCAGPMMFRWQRRLLSTSASCTSHLSFRLPARQRSPRPPAGSRIRPDSARCR